MNAKIKKLGWYRNGSFSKYSKRVPLNQMVCYWIVDCEASRRAAINSATDLQHPWIFATRSEAKIKRDYENWVIGAKV